MKGKVVEEFRVFTVEVSYCKKVGIKDRARKANELLGKDKRVEQGVVERKQEIFVYLASVVVIKSVVPYF